MATTKVGVYRKYHGRIPKDSSGNAVPKAEWPRKRPHSWAVRWFGLDGGRYSRSFETRKEAVRFAESKQSEVREGNGDPPPDIGLADFQKEHESLMTGQVSRNTLREQTRALGYLGELLENKLMRRVTRHDAERYIRRRSRVGVSASTINKEIASLKRVFNLAQRRSYLPEGSNPFVGIDKRKVSQRAKRYVSGEEVRRIIKHAPSLKWRVLLSLLYTTGLRLSEACHLTWDDVDFGTGMVQVAPKRDPRRTVPWEPKDHELRHIPLGKATAELLRGWQSARADGVPYLFVPAERYERVMQQLRGGQWHEGRELMNNVLRSFKVIVKNAGARPCTVHDLRRSCLTNWAREVPAHVLQRLAGHSSMETTLKYYLSVERSDLEKARQVGDAAILSGDSTDPKLTHSALNRQNGAFPAAASKSADCPKSMSTDDLGGRNGWYARRDSNAGPAV